MVSPLPCVNDDSSVLDELSGVLSLVVLSLPAVLSCVADEAWLDLFPTDDELAKPAVSLA